MPVNGVGSEPDCSGSEFEGGSGSELAFAGGEIADGKDVALGAGVFVFGRLPFGASGAYARGVAAYIADSRIDLRESESQPTVSTARIWHQDSF